MKDSKGSSKYRAEALISRIMEVLFLVPIFVITTFASKILKKFRRKT